MFQGCKEDKECDFYDRILRSWSLHGQKDPTVWMAQSLISLFNEDRRRPMLNRMNWNKILCNCIVIILALARTSTTLDLFSFSGFSSLNNKQKQQVIEMLLREFN